MCIGNKEKKTLTGNDSYKIAHTQMNEFTFEVVAVATEPQKQYLQTTFFNSLST